MSRDIIKLFKTSSRPTLSCFPGSTTGASTTSLGTLNLASIGVFIFQWQEPALSCETPSMAKLVHALGLEGIMWIKVVSSQKEGKGCTLPKVWNLWEFDTTRNMREIPPESLIFLQRLPHFKLWAFCLDLDLTNRMGDCSLTLAMVLSLAKNQKIPILSNQLVEGGERGEPTPNKPNLNEKITIWKEGKQSSLWREKPFKDFFSFFFLTKRECQTVVWN